MNQGVYSLAATMVNQLNRVDVLSNNLANANTTGFKQDNLVEGSFNHYLEKSKNENIQTTKLNVVNNTVPKIDGDYISSMDGPIVTTGNKLDFAINERDVFFKVEGLNKEVLLTKDGAFKNKDGFLVNHDGAYVLNNENERINITDGFESQIALVKTPYENIDKVGNNNYKINDTKKTTLVLDNDPYLLQGSIEKSNVNAITTMVSLIDSQRRLEQAQKASTGIDDINQKLIDKLSR
jgi:flagellar basal-body rod protein FlgG